jgi:limonene 1,2-monooxygenase
VDRRAPLGRHRDHRLARDLHRGGGQRTRHIKLGTGVVSVSYHNPLWVAERIVQLDHMTRGRFMLGLGPGSLPSDAAMIGISTCRRRELLEDGLGIIMKLLTARSP